MQICFAVISILDATRGINSRECHLHLVLLQVGLVDDAIKHTKDILDRGKGHPHKSHIQLSFFFAFVGSCRKSSTETIQKLKILGCTLW